ncbi:hypothetical protein [uncultured Selenomonas sp.]|uniref:hypothetical protein n=1 Tax=uncultured Selenomonas sp. TaxID=159275 RepID=UPI002620ADED|nr:hypothetical protein [uncultured Selenomonas sp.]
MSSVHRVVDYPEFAESINKSKRRKLVEYIRKERTYKRVPERAIQVIPLYGWFEDNNSRRDSGEIRAFVKIQDIVFMIIDNLVDGKEEFHRTLIDEEIIRFIGASERRAAPAPTIKKKDGTPFAGFNGGRKKKELTSEEKARILALRKEGNNVNVIARELHISNRIVSEFVKKN